MTRVLSQVGLSFKKLHRNNYIITPAPKSAPTSSIVSAAQDVTVAGKVTQTNGEGLPGVTIVVKGTTIGTSTGIDGSFSLAVPEGSTLVFSSVGFSKKEVTVQGATSSLAVTLTDDQQALDEVVVVGYGTQKKGDVTGAIASFDAQKLTERPIARVDQALVGQLAGVQVKQTTGAPGRGFSVQVRGAGSITANNEPLYVIDGLPLEAAAQNAAGRYGVGSPLPKRPPRSSRARAQSGRRFARWVAVAKSPQFALR